MGDDPQMIVFEAFGVTAEMVVEEPWAPGAVAAHLPPGWRHGDRSRVGARFLVSRDGDVTLDGTPVSAEGANGDGQIAAVLRAHVALHAPEFVFVHAGVVAIGDRALVLPGSTYSGKTTLVAELVRGGATYYSDEFAVLDRRGLVHAFAKPLSMRLGPDHTQTEVPVELLGGAAGSRPASVALIALTRYREGAIWASQSRSAGAGALALLANTIPARSRRAQSLRAVGRAAAGSLVVHSKRGEAREAAAVLLATLERQAAGNRHRPRRQKIP